ncbi:hypothetical protein F1880_000919 [Penicillium rolfsii]|nr:hypothetical protein F1880_000919 [Penicillium rolfsii]
MLLHPVYRILTAVLPLVALCSASGSNDTSNAALWNTIPDCAINCVGNFIDGQYTSDECSSADDIKCLCRTKTPLGLTLGEAALSCLYALCSEKDISSKGNSVYHVCDSVSGAIRETHATITATTFDPPGSTGGATITSAAATSASDSQTHPSSSTSTLPSSTTPLSSSSDSTHTFQTPSSDSGVPASTSTQNISTTSGVKPTSSSSTDGSSKHHVGSSTVIGVSVASGVAGSFIIGVAVFFCCKRWRQRNRSLESDSDHDFEIGGTMSEPPGFSRTSSRRSSPSSEPNPLGPSSFVRATSRPEVSELPCSHTPTSATVMLVPNAEQEQLRDREPIGVAVSSAEDWQTTPRTRSSQHTLAEPVTIQALGLYPKPLKWSHRPDSGETLFEEDDFQQPQGLHRNVPHRKILQKSQSPRAMTGLPANPRALKNGFPAHKYLRPSPHQQLIPRQTPSPSPRQAVYGDRTFAPAFPTAALHGFPPSNSSSTSHNNTGSSQRNSAETLLKKPYSTGQGRILSGMSNVNPGPTQAPAPRPSPRQPTTTANKSISGPGPGPTTPAPPTNGLGLSTSTKIISQPRIVRREDIKRVQIRSSPRPPSEVVVPYCPEDFWLERGRSQAPVPAAPSGLPYPSEASPGAILYPRSPQKRPQDVRRLSATGRSLTPSRRGHDLILRVD